MKNIWKKNSYLVVSYNGKIKSFKTNRVIWEMLICGVEMLHWLIYKDKNIVYPNKWEGGR
jgi:hypothetical protein